MANFLVFSKFFEPPPSIIYEARVQGAPEKPIKDLSFGNFDLVIAADYGHGYFSRSIISLIEEKSSLSPLLTSTPIM